MNQGHSILRWGRCLPLRRRTSPPFFLEHPDVNCVTRALSKSGGYMLHLVDLREILRYVPRFRDRLFVIALDGAVVDDENFRNLLLDIALLRSLRIGVVLVHGAAHQIGKLAQLMGQTPSNLDGTGVTDAQ